MALAIVQSAATAANSGSSQPTTNWPATPTNGNLLLAFGYIRQNATPNPVNGWQVFNYTTTANWYPVCYYKYASSAAQVEAVDAGTGFQEWGLSFWEVSGVAGSVRSDIARVVFGGQNAGTTSPSLGSITTLAQTTLVLGGYSGQFPAAGNTVSWTGATAWTHDADYVAPNGDAFGVHNWASGGHQAVTSGSSVSLTISASTNPNAWTGGYIELGTGASSLGMPAYVQSGAMATGGSGSTSVSVQYPATTTAGHLAIMMVAFYNSTSGANPAIATPSGWTLATVVRTSNNVYKYLFYQQLTGAEGGTGVTISTTGGVTPGSTGMFGGAISEFSNANFTSTPIESLAVTEGAAFAVNGTSVSSLGAARLHINAVVARTDTTANTTPAPPFGWTNQISSFTLSTSGCGFVYHIDTMNAPLAQQPANTSTSSSPAGLYYADFNFAIIPNPNGQGSGGLPFPVYVGPVTGQALINGVAPAAPPRPPLASLPIAAEPSVWNLQASLPYNASSKFIGYSVTLPITTGIAASKFVGYSVVGPPGAVMSSKFIGYAVAGPPATARASKFIGYAVLGPSLATDDVMVSINW